MKIVIACKILKESQNPTSVSLVHPRVRSVQATGRGWLVADFVKIGKNGHRFESYRGDRC